MQRFELLFLLAWRDILVRYKHAFLGISWALIRPLMNLILFSLLFQEDPLFILAGLIPWQFIASVLQSTSVSLIQNSSLIQKASFPRIFIPMSSLMVNGVDFLLSLFCFFIIALPVHPFFFLFFLAHLFLLGLTVSLWCSAIAVRVKDLIIAIPYLIQVGIFISPVGYSLDRFPESIRPYFLLNPLVGVIDGFRWSLLGERSSYIDFSIPYSVAFILVALFFGYFFFKKVETHIADTL